MDAPHARIIVATCDSSELGPHLFVNLIHECLPAASSSSAHRVTRASIRPTFVLGSKDQNEYSPLLYYCRLLTPSLGTIGELKTLEKYLDLVVIISPFAFEPSLKVLRVESILRYFFDPLPRHCGGIPKKWGITDRAAIGECRRCKTLWQWPRQIAPQG
jgi:hypothetical protein